eukprot:scaffold69100_cov39-Prasinocladus_malaysianus.AAC.1
MACLSDRSRQGLVLAQDLVCDFVPVDVSAISKLYDFEDFGPRKLAQTYTCFSNAGMPQALEEKLARKEVELADLRSSPRSSHPVLRLSVDCMSCRKRVSSDSGTSSASSQASTDTSKDHPPKSEAETARLRTQITALTDINKTLLDKCKATKSDKAGLENELADRNAAYKLLDTKYKLLVKKFAPNSGSKPPTPS